MVKESLGNGDAVILIIDSDPLTLTAMAAVLDMQGYQCHCARDAEAAKKAAHSLPLDLIICDVQLAGQSGLDLCAELRSEPQVSEVPVMFISATQLPDVVRRAHDNGGAYFLRKPFDPSVLIELVNNALWMPQLVQSQLRYNVAPAMASGSGIPAPMHWPAAAAERRAVHDYSRRGERT